MAQYSTFDELASGRRSLVVAAHENGFETGLRKLLADLYPDNAHFIYELLQNAEDAGAREVHFKLERSRLVVTHDGTRDFTLKDVEAITGIGASQKEREDRPKIGKFGVGFKAVFAYTDTPEVHSGDYSFVIEDLFVPQEIIPCHAEGKTTFVFPFNSPDKPQSSAYEEVRRGLGELGTSTILFLAGIETIRYEIDGGVHGYITRTEEAPQRVKIEESHGREVLTSWWLRLSGRAADLLREFTVAAAFRLEPVEAHSEVGEDRRGFRVQPLDEGKTCIFFPAVKERSGLRFHIHAPFASTVARDSVLLDDSDNKVLVKSIGKVVAEALPQLRDEGLLDDGLLAALPNGDDPLEAPYDTIRDLVYEAFNTTDLTPIHGGGSFAPAVKLFNSPQQFRSGLDQEDLVVLLALINATSVERPRWVAPRGGRPGQFLRGLKLNGFGWAGLERVLDVVEDAHMAGKRHRDVSALWESWIASKSIDRLRAFYELLGLGVMDGQIKETYDLPLIRVVRGEGVEHVGRDGIYLPADPADVGPDRVPAALAFFSGDPPSKSKDHLERFFDWFGVKRWDDRARIEQLLEPYERGDRRSVDLHFDDMRQFISHHRSRPRDSVFSKAKIFLAKDKEGKEFFVPASELVIDDPFISTGLSMVSNRRFKLSERYHMKVDYVVEFASYLGAKTELTLQPIHPSRRNPEFKIIWTDARITDRGERRDWDLEEFEKILRLDDPSLLRSVWILACKTRESIATAVYQANGSTKSHFFRSRIMQRLEDSAWIVDRDGSRRTPRSMALSEMAIDWPPPERGSLASCLSFGGDARARDASQEARRQQAAALGVPLELVDELSDLDSTHMAEVLDLVREVKERARLPESPSEDPDRRTSLVGEDAADAPVHSTQKRFRSVVTHEHRETKKRATGYLRDQYSTEQGVHCQICQQSSEFKVDGDWYFERIEFVGNRERLHHQNYLSLCPRCAAKYTHVRNTSDEALLDGVKNLTIAPGVGSVMLPVTVNGEELEIRFTGKHAIDVRAVLTAAGEGRAKR
jgi:hypothetical protein